MGQFLQNLPPVPETCAMCGGSNPLAPEGFPVGDCCKHMTDEQREELIGKYAKRMNDAHEAGQIERSRFWWRAMQTAIRGRSMRHRAHMIWQQGLVDAHLA